MTSKEAVFELLKKEKDVGDPVKQDPATLRREWCLALNELVGQFREWLRTAESEGLLSVKKFSVRIHELRLGDYEAPALEIVTPRGFAVSIKPKARFVVGGAGRVDFDAAPRLAILIRKDRTHWQFAKLAAEQGQWLFVDLDENSFWKTLNELLM